ncbi:MAG: hypothetical protein IKQ46_00105 [Bacteroidales bacterium]|nr:hypothetical protein [Bacteroidales bacterium]
MQKYILLFLLLFNSLALLAQERADHPVKGYHAFIDGGFNTAIGSNRYNRISFSTSHGVQLNPFLFVGAGEASQFYLSEEGNETYVDYCEPLFADIRIDFKPKKVSPFLDFRIGGSFVGDITGFYTSITGGVRVGRCNFSLGYELQFIEDYDNPAYDSYSWDGSFVRDPASSIVFKVGIDLGSR